MNINVWALGQEESTLKTEILYLCVIGRLIGLIFFILGRKKCIQHRAHLLENQLLFHDHFGIHIIR